MRAQILKTIVLASVAVLFLGASFPAAAGKDPKNPLWWDK